MKLKTFLTHFVIKPVKFKGEGRDLSLSVSLPSTLRSTPGTFPSESSVVTTTGSEPETPGTISTEHCVPVLSIN